VEIRIDTKEIRQALQKAQRTLGNLSPIMANVAQLMRRTVEKNFDAEGRDEMGRTKIWKPLAPSTQKQRARYKGEAYAEHPILEYKGRLKQSINTAHGKDFAQVYTGVRYGVYHQVGTRKMPARPFMVMPKSDLAEIRDYIAQRIEQEIVRR